MAVVDDGELKNAQMPPQMAAPLRGVKGACETVNEVLVGEGLASTVVPG